MNKGFNKKIRKSAGILMLLFLSSGILIAADSEKEALPYSLLPPEEIVKNHPLARQLEKVLQQGKCMSDFVPTGLRKASYLQCVNNQLRAMRVYQNEEGRIIDPVKKMEFAYSTPCYAHAVATLAAEGFNTDPELIRSGQRALGIAIKDMVEGKCANNHGDFYTYPVMLALRQFQKILPVDQIENWMKQMAKVDPAKIYRMFDSAKNNWSVVNAAGEFLRSLKGLTSLAYTDRILAKQQSCFTIQGLYQEEGNPFAYDAFCRYFVSGLLHYGYRGPLFSWYRDVTWKGAWTSLMIQSPFGELPMCFRSSQHLWNEAELACVYEVYASAYARAGRPLEAGMFKRGAHLALQSLLSWIRPDGSGYIVKNHYPPKAEQGYERYSSHTCYNLLACSMLCEAWAVADDSIEEKPAPADVGGFVISIPEFDMVVANSGGAYVQYMTKGNQKYNPTGLIRIHLKKGHPQLGPSDVMIASPDSEGLKAWAVGLAWKPQGGDWCSLAEYPGRKDEGPQGNPPGQVAVLEEKSDSVAFSVNFKWKGISVSERIHLGPEGIQVEDELSGKNMDLMRVYYPMLIFDGLKETSVRVEENRAWLSLDGRGVEYEVAAPKGVMLKRSGRSLKSRNGMVEPLYGDAAGMKVCYVIRAFEDRT